MKTILFFNTLIGTSWTFASKPDCPIDEPDKNIPHEDCSKFYSCSFGKLVENTCPVGLHFHPELDVNNNIIIFTRTHLNLPNFVTIEMRKSFRSKLPKQTDKTDL